MNDLTDNITFTSDPILVTIINTPPPEPPTHITVKNNPENINFTTPSTNPITDFKYTLDTTNNTLTLDGFTNAVTVTDDELVLKPASTYTIESVAYTVTAINKDAFTPSNIPVSYKKMIISFPETMKTLGESCF
jgi:hypothetical protein